MSVVSMYLGEPGFEELSDEIEQVGNRFQELMGQLNKKYPLPDGYVWSGSYASARPRPWGTVSEDDL